MTIPVLGPVSVSAFAHPWYWLFALVPAAVVALYIGVQRRKRRHVMRFANMALLEQVAPQQNRAWRHLAAVLLVGALLLLTVAMAGPAYAVRIPRNRAVVMLVIDVSESMAAQDVAPNRLAAAKKAGKQFADELTPGINLGLISFAGTATVLVSPTADHARTKAAVDKLQLAERTATGEAIYTALQAIATVGAVLGGGDGPPPARIVLESDGKETVPSDPEAPRGAYPAARAAKEQGVPISTISFGTPDGYVTLDDQQQPAPVDDETLQTITDITGGQAFHAGSLGELSRVYAELEQQIGFETIHADASAAWLRLGVFALVAAALAGLVISRPLPC